MRYFLLSFALIVSGLLLNSSVLFAEKVCVKKKLKVKANGRVPHRNALKVESGDCAGSFVELFDTSTLTGPQGPAGEDASSLLYGNGSAGDLSVTSNTTFQGANLNFEDITIDAGVTLAVRSGAVFRCTGAFTNNGTLRVAAYASGGAMWSADGQLYNAAMPAFLTQEQAAPGECGAAGTLRSGAPSLGGVTASFLAQYIKLGPLGGGGGAGFAGGGAGGGTVTILCNGLISNTGTIKADGDTGFSGSGGGGGGIIVLASGTGIENTGTIQTLGGNGGSSSSTRGAGGGGGGGLVHFISPSITAGTTDVSGGAAGDDSVNATADPACAGGAGGGSAGISGEGGEITAVDVSSTAGAGFSGGSIETAEDPVDVFGVY